MVLPEKPDFLPTGFLTPTCCFSDKTSGKKKTDKKNVRQLWLVGYENALFVPVRPQGDIVITSAAVVWNQKTHFEVDETCATAGKG